MSITLEDFKKENLNIFQLFEQGTTLEDALIKLKTYLLALLQNRPDTLQYYRNKESGSELWSSLSWSDYAVIRMLDYIDHTGETLTDISQNNKELTNTPFSLLYKAIKSGKIDGHEAYFTDMLMLFKQFSGNLTQHTPSRETLQKWMDRHASGLDQKQLEKQQKNRARISAIIAKRIASGEAKSSTYFFPKDSSEEEQLALINSWWNEPKFHLAFAIRTPELLNEMLNYSLDKATLDRLNRAREKKIPLFINPHYLTLFDIEASQNHIVDQVLRDYVFPNDGLIETFGNIVAWEKEDIVKEGTPNAAGWLLPSGNNLHRRYPEVAILIPKTRGRACGGLCVSCQRMYGFQHGNLNFNLNKLAPNTSWEQNLEDLLQYFEKDAQLRDILVTGGDAFMNSDDSLQLILDKVYEMAVRKRENNRHKPKGENFAEMQRIRLGTRLPVYLPQRISPTLIQILKHFKERAAAIGFKQFVIQTHFQTALEITPEVKSAIAMLHSAGWIVTNQTVFTTAASIRGYIAKLRQELNKIGVIPYYTFSVKGFTENRYNYATKARALQEQIEEKSFGKIPSTYYKEFELVQEGKKHIKEVISSVLKKANLPFISSDKSVLNLPGVGKSLAFRTIGVLDDGRRVLEFAHNEYREQSPIVQKMGKVIIIESKAIKAYLDQLSQYGEEIKEYQSIYGYSLGFNKPHFPLYNYPDYDFDLVENNDHFKG